MSEQQPKPRSEWDEIDFLAMKDNFFALGYSLLTNDAFAPTAVNIIRRLLEKSDILYLTTTSWPPESIQQEAAESAKFAYTMYKNRHK